MAEEGMKSSLAAILGAWNASELREISTYPLTGHGR